METVIQSFWVGHIGTIERLAMSSYAKNGHPFDLYSYGVPYGDVPEGVTIKDARDIVPENDIWEFNTPQQFADWFRWNLLYKKGGWWVDLDTVCLRPFDLEQSTVLVEEALPNDSVKSIAWAMRTQDLRDIWQGGGRFIGNGFLKFSAGSDVLKWMINECQELRSEWRSLPWISIGPALVTRAANLFRIPSFSYTAFQPIPGYLANLFLDASTVVPDNCYAVHLWKSAWDDGLNSGGVVGKLKAEGKDYPPSCPYEVLKRRYL